MCTSMNLQPYRVVVAREKNMKDKVRECLVGSNTNSTKNASAFVTFLCDISIKLDKNVINIYRSMSKH